MLRISPNSNHLTIDGSGKHGRNGSSGHAGAFGGGSGSHGGNGQDGTDALNITFNLSSQDEKNIVNVDIEQSRYLLTLGDQQTKITTKAMGGDGGDGGHGGRGGEGIRGSDGQPATRYSWGTNGSDGGDGGSGGDGGHGGDGGNGGNVTIKIKPEDTDLLMLVDQPATSGGRGGEGGSSGSGGTGGRGGSGGSGFSWTEAVIHHHHDQEGKPQTTTETVWHYQPGGSSGSSGSDGHSGHSGNSGKNGTNGHFKIDVMGNKSYSGFYDLSLKSIGKIQSDDGIIEPGEILSVNNITFQNTGMMPTPSYQPIYISLTNNYWVDFDPKDTLSISHPISPSETTTLPSPLPFRLKEAKYIPAINTTFRDTAFLQFKANLNRVNKSFDKVKKQFQSIDVQFPVEISTVSLPPTISRDEEAPFVLELANISKKPIGEHRPLGINISLKNGLEKQLLKFGNLDGEFKQTFNTPITQTFRVDSEKKIVFAGVLKFEDSTPPYSQVSLACDLQLGQINQPGGSSDTIQRREFKIQLADCFKYNPDADFVLVTNNETDQKTIYSWQKMAAEFGTSISIWNTSLYSGLSYFQKRYDQGSFFDQMRDKAVIILNNPMRMPDHKNTTYSTQCLDQAELLIAAKKANVSTYVMGQNFNLTNSLIPTQHVSDTDQRINIEEKFLFWRTPTENDLKEKATELCKELQMLHPDKRYVAFYNFDAKPIPTNQRFNLRTTWNLGDIEIRETLDATQSHIAYRETSSDTPHDVDLYPSVKLLPFRKKLIYLDRAMDEYHAHIIKTAILSDLAKEMLAFAQYKWNWGDRFTLIDSLVNLKMLFEYQFQHKDHLQDLLVKLDYFAKRLPTFADRVFPCFCTRIQLRDLCQGKIKRMEDSLFSKESVSKAKKSLEEQLGKQPRQDILNFFAKPYQLQVAFDNDISFTTPRLLSDISHYRPKVSFFKENRHLFSNRKEREKCIESYQTACRF